MEFYSFSKLSVGISTLSDIVTIAFLDGDVFARESVLDEDFSSKDDGHFLHIFNPVQSLLGLDCKHGLILIPTMRGVRRIGRKIQIFINEAKN